MEIRSTAHKGYTTITLFLAFEMAFRTISTLCDASLRCITSVELLRPSLRDLIRTLAEVPSFMTRPKIFLYSLNKKIRGIVKWIMFLDTTKTPERGLRSEEHTSELQSHS